MKRASKQPARGLPPLPRAFAIGGAVYRWDDIATAAAVVSPRPKGFTKNFLGDIADRLNRALADATLDFDLEKKTAAPSKKRDAAARLEKATGRYLLALGLAPGNPAELGAVMRKPVDTIESLCAYSGVVALAENRRLAEAVAFSAPQSGLEHGLDECAVGMLRSLPATLHLAMAVAAFQRKHFDKEAAGDKHPRGAPKQRAKERWWNELARTWLAMFGREASQGAAHPRNPDADPRAKWSKALIDVALKQCAANSSAHNFLTSAPTDSAARINALADAARRIRTASPPAKLRNDVAGD